MFPYKASINNTNKNIIFPTAVFTLQLAHSASSLPRTSECRGRGADDPQAGALQSSAVCQKQRDGLTGAILGCFVSCHSFIPLKFLVSRKNCKEFDELYHGKQKDKNIKVVYLKASFAKNKFI